MTFIQEIFAKNGRTRNIIFIIALSLFILLGSTSLLMGHKFLVTAPLLVVIMLTAIVLQPPKYYYSFCVGVFLSYGLFLGTMSYLVYGASFPMFFDLIVGCIGFLLLIASIWQAILGDWKLSRIADMALQVVLILGFILILFTIVKVEMHGIKAPETEQHETY